MIQNFVMPIRMSFEETLIPMTKIKTRPAVIILLLLSLLLSPAATLPAAAQSAIPAVQDFSSLESLIREELQATKTPGAAISIVKGDRVIYAKGFGVANVETGAPVTTDMLFRLGSTTKMFTAAALITLSSRGKLKLDAPVGSYLTGINPKLARITTHQLLSNSGGMADFAAPFVSQDDEALGRMIRGWKEDALYTEPGEVYSYASPGYWLAGYVLEETSKKAYADAMNELIFAPSGMTSTTLRPLQAMTFPLAMGHNVSAAGTPAIIRPAFNNVAMWPAGSIYSNVKELSRFVIALLNGGKVDGKQALAPDVPARLFGKYISMPGDREVYYGYGLLNFEDRGVRMMMHGGFSRGYGSMIQMVPEGRLAVIIQTNRSGETLPRTRMKAMELFLKLKDAAPPKPKQAEVLTESDRANFAGKYINGPQTWEIVARNGKLFYKRTEGDLELKKTAPYRLSFGDKMENDFMFVPNARGEIQYIFDGLYSARKS
jgi:CubicO group peptidase (beta-lactamase class C family)